MSELSPTLVNLIWQVVLASALLGLSLGVAAYSTWGERKFAAYIQDRFGPNRAGPLGLLQPVFDGVKLFTKEEFWPSNASRFLFLLGPSIAMLTALITSAIIPWGSAVSVMGQTLSLQLADPNVAMLYVFAVVSIGVYGVMIGGWASNNKFSLLGALRASSQMISYELAMGLALIGVIMLSGSLSLRDIVDGQPGWHWNVLVQPVGFLVFLVCAFAECNRHPFDLAECEAELVGGYHTEFSSMKLGMYLFAEYINMFISSVIMASLFFGGYHFPFEQTWANFLAGHFGGATLVNLVALSGTLVLLLKAFGLVIFFMWIRWTLPRFRYDQLQKLGWTVLIPLAIGNLLWTGVWIWMRGGFNQP